jgi:hypothetical protein
MRDSAKIAHLDSVFQQAMNLICNKVIAYAQDHCELEEEENFR